jgi:ParB family chromosome partitioning protein
MSTTPQTFPTVADAIAAATNLQDISLSKIHESPLNARRTFNQTALEELAQTIKTAGIISDLLCRPHPDKPGQYELVDGARRYRAAQTVAIKSAPIKLANLTNAQVREIVLITMLQREELNPVEEAQGYKELMTDSKLTADQVADRVGKSRKYVYDRVKLLDLTDKASAALVGKNVSPGHAILLARIAPTNQDAAVAAMKAQNWQWSVRDLDTYLDRAVRRNLNDAHFSQLDPDLNPAIGKCDGCQFREKNRCTNPACFQLKISNDVKKKRAALEASAGLGLEKFLLLTDSYHEAPDVPKEALTRDKWEEAKPGDKKAVTGLVIHGLDAGKQLKVRLSAETHKESKDHLAEYRKRVRREKAKANAERAVRVNVLQAMAAKAKTADSNVLTAATQALAQHMGPGQAATVLHLCGQTTDPKKQQPVFQLRHYVESASRAKLPQLLLYLTHADDVGPYLSNSTSLDRTAKPYRVDIAGMRRKAYAEAMKALDRKAKPKKPVKKAKATAAKHKAQAAAKAARKRVAAKMRNRNRPEAQRRRANKRKQARK